MAISFRGRPARSLRALPGRSDNRTRSLSKVMESDLFGVSEDLDGFVNVGNEVADAAGEVIRRYFRKKVEILDKDDLSTILLELC